MDRLPSSSRRVDRIGIVSMGSDNRHKHVRGARAATGRWGARGGVALLALSLLGTATITSSASATAGRAPQSLAAADDDPQRVLQSVSVGVGPDGSITGIDSTSISKTDSSDLTTADESFDPASVAGDLPVRILTSYRLGDRSGTDLSEIVGESGRVEIEVVVQNTTVRPQKLTYDVDSTERSQFALWASLSISMRSQRYAKFLIFTYCSGRLAVKARDCVQCAVTRTFRAIARWEFLRKCLKLSTINSILSATSKARVSMVMIPWMRLRRCTRSRGKYFSPWGETSPKRAPIVNTHFVRCRTASSRRTSRPS